VTAGPLGPPWTLTVPVVEITRPQPPPVSITARTPAVVTVAWPRVRVVGDRPPPAPAVIKLAAPPQGPWRLPLPPVLRYLLAEAG